MEYYRTWSDLNERLRETEAAEGGLDAVLAELEAHQRETGFIKDDLANVERHVFRHPDDPLLTFRAQHNPKRALRFDGSGVRSPPANAESLNGGCFLCRENIRWQQQHAQVGFEINMTGDLYHAWMNPFPLLPNHVVIAEENHISQEWDIGGGGQERVTLSRLLGDLCEAAQRMPNHVGFYNGVDAGASNPSHLHFQFFRRPPADPVFPLERRTFRVPDEDGGPETAIDYPLAVALWRGGVGEVVANATFWVRRWADRNGGRLDRLSSNFIAAGQGLQGGVSLYFIPRDRQKSRWNESYGLVGGLELLGELVFFSEEEKAMLDCGEVDYFYVERALASVHMPFFYD